VTYVCPSPGPTASEGFATVVVEGARWRRTLLATAAILRSHADVTIVHDPELLPSAIALGLRRGRRRVVFDLHEDLPRQLRTRARTPRLLRRSSAVAARWLLRLAERAITFTLAEANYGWVFGRTHPTFENLPIASSLPQRDAQARGVVYVGDITEPRGAVLLVDAMAQVPGEPLTMIGRCDPGLEDDLRARAEMLGVPLTLTGFLPYDEAWSRAARARVGVSPLLDLPNYRHSLPTKVDEYRSVGLVAVASDLPGTVPAIEGSEAAITFSAGDVAALGAALREALGSDARAEAALGEASRMRVERHWDADGFAAFYADLVSREPDGRLPLDRDP
jgi:glycosyltransferase involved in cell wall biosynthesis